MSSSSYLDELTEAMTWLGQQPDTLFIGQQVAYDGVATYKTFAEVPDDRKIEFPVAENLQVGVSTGLSLERFVPVSVFPRWNFLLCAADQLVNHLDRLPLYSGYRPRVIIRTSVGRNKPLDPGPQHQDDFSEQFWRMCKTIHVHGPLRHGEVVNNYKAAYYEGGSWLLTEDGNLY